MSNLGGESGNRTRDPFGLDGFADRFLTTRSSRQTNTPGADDGSRTRLGLLGKQMPHHVGFIRKMMVARRLRGLVSPASQPSSPRRSSGQSQPSERVMGLEPTTSTLARSRSTTEPHPHCEGFLPRRGSREGCTPNPQPRCKSTSCPHLLTLSPFGAEQPEGLEPSHHEWHSRFVTIRLAAWSRWRTRFTGSGLDRERRSEQRGSNPPSTAWKAGL